jgi:putative transposase
LKRYKPEQIMSLLRKIEVAIANGKTTPQAAQEVGITEQTYYPWRKEFRTAEAGPGEAAEGAGERE